MSKEDNGETVMVPESREPQFPVNLTSWRHYDGLRLVAMAILVYSIIGFLETEYVTMVRIEDIRAEARAKICSRGKVGTCVDNVKQYWFGRPLLKLDTGRLFGSFISWMQEKTAPVFVVATANDVSQFPPELLRKVRWDELFFTDLPDAEEREMIWGIQIQRHGHKPQDFNVQGMALASEGHIGAEIEQTVVDALYRAFKRSNRHA